MENIEYTIIQLCHVRCFLFVNYIMALGVYMFVEQFCWDFVVYIVRECNCKSVIYSVSCSCWRSYTTRLSVGGATVGTCVYRTVRHALRGVIVSSDINSNRKYFCCNISIRIAHKWHHSRIRLCIRKLSAHLGDSEATGCCCGSPRGKHTMDWCLFGWQDINSSGLTTKTRIFFYLRTNNETKWQINQTTVDSNVHFTVDTIMYMSVILNIQCTQVWSGEENM